MSSTNNSANVLTAGFSLLVYGYSVASLISWWLFLVPNEFLPVAVADMKPYSIETAPLASGAGQAILNNLGATFFFGFFHSLMARKTVKKWMALPISVERSFFCLQGAFFLHMIQHCWVNVDKSLVLWTVTSTPMLAKSVLALFWAGSAILLTATFALDHFHLFGLSQGFGVNLNGMVGLAPDSDGNGLRTRWHYKHVAHPIMTGALINLWAAPVMTPARLGLALFLTAYIGIAVVCLEEHSIRAEIGEEYDAYLAKTPRFFPFVSLTNMDVHLKVTMEKNGTKKD